jgi:hypothetical protein
MRSSPRRELDTGVFPYEPDARLPYEHARGRERRR